MKMRVCDDKDQKNQQFYVGKNLFIYVKKNYLFEIQCGLYFIMS